MQRRLPVIGAHDLVAWEVELLTFELSGGQVQIDLAAEVAAQLPVLVHSDDRLIQRVRHLHRLANVEVVVTLDLLSLGGSRVDRRLQRQRLRQGGEPLLTVQDEFFRLVAFRDAAPPDPQPVWSQSAPPHRLPAA